MRARIIQPHPDYPLVWVRAPIDSQNRWTEQTGHIFGAALAKRGITLLGEWEADDNELKAPALIEDEHVKPKRPRRR